jgi:hypothetical protein
MGQKLNTSFHAYAKSHFSLKMQSLMVIFVCSLLRAQVPTLLNYQGNISVGGNPFEGQGHFKLALVNSDASFVYWGNDADGNGDGQPDASVSVTVSGGNCSILVGDTNIANMAALPASVFSNSDLYLRIWFNDGVNGFELLTPDQRIASVGYAMVAGDVPDGTISSAKLSASLDTTITDLKTQLSKLTTRLTQLESTAPPASGLTLVSAQASDADLLQDGYQAFYTIPSPEWAQAGTTGSPAARYHHTAVWSDSEMIVWGGYLGAGISAGTGARYNPASDTWTTLSSFGAPSARYAHRAVWTGNSMILWGGSGNAGYLNTGGIYIPESQTWSSLPTVGAPAARSDHVCLWNGSRMIIWGGRNSTGYLADGAEYDPATQAWNALPTANAPPARRSTAAVWTGDSLLVWGGLLNSGVTDSGGVLSGGNGIPQHWSAMSTENAPSARRAHGAVWTGSSMIVWGGTDGSNFMADGGIYNPNNNNNPWTSLPTEGAPTGRAGHVCLWTGSEMIVFGGTTAAGQVTASGAAYDPLKNRWRPLNADGNPTARSETAAVWSGSELILFGGQNGGKVLASLERLDPRPTWYFYRKP